MSRARTRPTREETRQRLFDAAAVVFLEHGVPAATIDQIVDEAGYTRGAFYSSFATKDELALAMLEAHLARSQRVNRQLLVENPSPAAFMEALRRDAGRDDEPLHQNPQLQIELMLHVAGTPAMRPRLGEHLATMRELLGELAEETLRASGRALPAERAELGMILMAIEDGLRLHRLIDPDSTPADAFVRALEVLQRVVLRP